MHIIRHNQSTGVSGKVTLPPISGNNKDLNTECVLNVNNAVTSTNVATVNGGGGVMVTQNASLMGSRGTNSKSLIYRSVPPKPHTFTLSDLIDTNCTHIGVSHSKKLGLTGSSSSEFAKRFMSRPTTQPKVVDFKVNKMSAQKRRRGINGFFPPVKLRGSAKAHEKSTPVSVSEPTPITVERNPLQLIPTAYSEVRPKSESRSISRSSRHSTRSIRKTPESVRTAPAPQENGVVYPETFDFDDISLLPRPKKFLPKRDLPWVFRYKVKRNMNEITKIMASKPGAVVDV